MKNIKILLLFAVAILFATASCTKDENGYKITYYRNKTVVGYCFYYYDFDKDSISPAKNVAITMKSLYSWSAWSSSKEHSETVYTDEFGKYFLNNIVKTIDGKKVTGYFLEPCPATVPSLQSFSYDDFNKHNYIQLDTFYIWVYIP